MLLLTDSISKEDSCWELRLRCGEFGEHPVRTGSERGKDSRCSPHHKGKRQGTLHLDSLAGAAVRGFTIVTAFPVPSSQSFPHGGEH